MPNLTGYRTVLFNLLLALVPAGLLILEELEKIDLATLGLTPEKVLTYTLFIKLANVVLRGITTTPLGQTKPKE